MPDRILAYTDKLTVEPGDLVEVKVSSPRAGTYRASLVRMICGDDSPKGPGFKIERVTSVPEAHYSARTQRIPCGSYVEIEDRQGFALNSFSLRTFIWPTWLDKGSEQCILGNYDAASGNGYALYLDGAGKLALRIGSEAPVVLAQPLLSRHWYLVAASFDATTGKVV